MKAVVSIWLWLFAVSQWSTCVADYASRKDLIALAQAGDHPGLLARIRELGRPMASLSLYDGAPSLFFYLGLALHGLGDLQGAINAFNQAIALQPNDVGSWFNLGDTLLQSLDLHRAAQVYEEMLARNLTFDPSKLYRARLWQADWRDADVLSEHLRSHLMDLKQKGLPPPFLSSGFSDCSPELVRWMAENLRQSQLSPVPVGSNNIASVRSASRLRVAFLSSDFGVHPVSQLLRGVLTESGMDKAKVEVFCFSLGTEESWWKTNITRSVEHFIDVSKLGHQQVAETIASWGIHVLIDLNGHTLGTGLPILSLKPVAVQISWLGHPLTTGAAFIDFFVADNVAVPAEMAAHFTEKLIVLSTCYLVNDYNQMHGHVPVEGRKLRYSIPGLEEAENSFLFASFSNYQKMSPPSWSTWMNVLRRTISLEGFSSPSSLWIQNYSGAEHAKKHLRYEMTSRGMDPGRMLSVPKIPWIQHVHSKTAADLVLDTFYKNGHTTGLDALWAGVPVVTSLGDRMERRATASMLAALEIEETTAASVKEFEDLAVYLASRPGELRILRQRFEEARTLQPLFNTTGFAFQLLRTARAAVEMKAAGEFSERKATMHIFFPSDDMSATDRVPLQPHSALQLACRVEDTRQSPLLLHIGGNVARKGWTVVDIAPLPGVDLVTPMNDLSVLRTSTAAAVYASHVLEHTSHNQASNSNVIATLKEWHRVLKPGGTVFIGVPDLAMLTRLFLDPSYAKEKFLVMRIIFGGQVDAHDFHQVGFDEAILSAYLTEAGFCNLRRVNSFGLFQDSSESRLRGEPISLNIIAEACGKPGPRVQVSTGYPTP